MIRTVTINDADQLNDLNNEFNGKGETTIESITNCLASNPQEVIVVDDDNGMLTGFVCVQLKKSFCYNDYRPEVYHFYDARLNNEGLV